MNSQNKKFDPRELIVKVRNNDQKAFEILFEQYRPLIDASVNRFSLDEAFALYREDLRQEASVVFYNSILAYDLEQSEVEFGLFAKICIHNALVSQLRVLKKNSAQIIEQLTENLFLQEADDPSSEMLEQERINSIYAVIRKNLSSFEYSVWQLYLSGRSSSEIARLCNTDKKSISNAIYRIRKKLRTLLQ